MKIFKRITLLVVIALICLSGCSKKKEVVLKVKEVSWAEKVGINDQLSVDELYIKAKVEGTVTVYSMSSRFNAVKETFEAQYPGIKVVVYDMRNSEIIEKYQREHEANIHNADVLFIKDSDGAVQNEFVNMGLLQEYIPEDMMVTAPKAYQTGAYTPYFEMKQIFYNTEVYDSSPIDNWWDLTKPEFKAKIILRSPISNSETMGLLLAMVRNSDEMAEAYKQEFGEEIVLDGTENAGYEFLKRLEANDLIMMTSDTEIVKAVGAPGQENPPFGIATSSKMRKASDSIMINVAEELYPRLGVADPAYLYIADQAENVNAAKLLLRWVGGEADGTGPGFNSFHVRGSWPSRADVAPKETQLLETLDLWDVDLMYNYTTLEDVRNFWMTL